MDDEGIPLCMFERLEVRLHGYRLKKPDKRFDLTYEPTDIRLSLHQGTPPLSNRECTSFTGIWARSDETHTLVLEYVRQEEMKIKAAILSLDVNQPWSILVVAEEGLSGDASLGFTRSLRKEYPNWTVRVAVFSPSLGILHRVHASRELAAMKLDEPELKLDADGLIYVPRIHAVEPPPAQIPFDSTKPWMFAHKLFQIHSPKPAYVHVVVHVNGVCQPRRNFIWAFFGTIEGRSPPFVGISSSPLCSHLEVRAESLVEIHDTLFSGSSGPPILASALLALVVGPRTFAHPLRLRGKRLLVVVEPDDHELGCQIDFVAKNLGMDVTVLSSPLVEGQLQKFYLDPASYALVGVCKGHDETIVRSLVSPSGRILPWNDPEEGIAQLSARDPCTVGDAVRSALSYHSKSTQPSSVAYCPPAQLLDGALTTASLSPNLFNAHKSYLLVGGIGSLGLHIALWMYEVGT